MMTFSRLFRRWFDDKEISRNELTSFSEDLLSNLTANNPDEQFDPLIAALDPAPEAMGGARTTRASAESIKEARTRATEQLFRTIRETVSRREGRVKDAFGKKSPEYQAFFPQGLNAWSDMTSPQVEPMLGVLINAATAHLPALVAEFTGLRDQWVAIRGSQVAQKGTAGSGQLAENAARTALGVVLQRTVLTVAAAFIGQPEMADIYFNQSLLEDPASAEEEEEPEQVNP